MSSEELKQIFNYRDKRSHPAEPPCRCRYCGSGCDAVSPSCHIPWRFSTWQGAAASIDFNWNDNHSLRQFELTPRRRRGTRAVPDRTNKVDHEVASPLMGEMPGIFSPEPLFDVSRLKNPYVPRSILAVYCDVNDEGKHACATRTAVDPDISHQQQDEAATEISQKTNSPNSDHTPTSENVHNVDCTSLVADAAKKDGVSPVYACESHIEAHRGDGDQSVKWPTDKSLDNIVYIVQKEVLFIVMLFFFDVILCFHAC